MPEPSTPPLLPELSLKARPAVWAFRVFFGLTLVGLLFLTYGFVLLFREDLASGETYRSTVPEAAIAPAQRPDLTPGTPVEPEPVSAEPRLLKPRTVERAQPRFSIARIVMGMKAGEEHSIALFYTGLGIAGTLLFGFSTLLFWVIIEPRTPRAMPRGLQRRYRRA